MSFESRNSPLALRLPSISPDGKRTPPPQLFEQLVKLVEIEPGGMRELHWHTKVAEWQYYISGEARMTVFASQNNAHLQFPAFSRDFQK